MLHSAASACFPPDRAALGELASSFLQSWEWPTSKAFEGWKGEECCTWRGVVCRSHSAASASNASVARVSKLLLSKRNLEGAFPEAICSLSALTTLDLSHNLISGPIAYCLGQNLTNLRQLDLSYNLLNGTIPQSFSGLRRLTALDLGGQNVNPYDTFWLGGLRGSVLPVSALPSLTYLDLSDNFFQSIPPFNTPSLLWLSMRGLALDYIPLFTNATPNLQYLDLSWSWFTRGLTNLSASPLNHLQYLDLSQCQDFLSEHIPVSSIISSFPQLRTLFLNSSSLAAEGSQISELLCGLKSLEALSIPASSNLSGQMLPPPCKRPSINLTYLDLSHNELRGPLPAWMSLFSNLQHLDLSSNNFDASAYIPPEWQNLTKLTSLRLSTTTISPSFNLPTSMQNWLFRLPLQTLTLSSIGLANQHIPCSQLSLLNTTLEFLNFSNNLLTDSYALGCLAQHNFTALATLDLSSNPLAFNLNSLAAIPPSKDGTLNLASCQLKGELTDGSFGMLSSFSELYLGNNFLTGFLPSRIGSFLNFAQELDLSTNHFSGPIPSSVGNITALRKLYLDDNYLHGEVPQELGNLSSLQILFLGNNQLTRSSLTHTRSYLLEILDLSHNRLEGDLQSFFGDYSLFYRLTILLLGDNRLTGAIPHVPFNGTSAKVLSIIQLSNNRLTGTIPHTLIELFPCLTVKKQYISMIVIEKDFTVVVKNLQLTYHYQPYWNDIPAILDLSSNMLHGSIPEALGDLSRLSALNLSRNQLTGPIPSSLSKLSLLESFDLSYNRLQGSIPASLSQLTQLEVFNVSFNSDLTGPIPNSPQFNEQPDSYINDSNLCGEPILPSCSNTSTPATSHQHLDLEISESKSFLLRWIHEWIAIPGLCIGLVIGFAGVIWVLRLIGFV